MRYFLIILLFFIGCNNSKTEKTIKAEKNIEINNIQTENTISKKDAINTIKIKDLIFKIDNNKITYNFNNFKTLLFIDDSKSSKFQIEILNSLNKNFYIIKNKKLIQYFNISTYPTIIITKDINHTKKYEGLIPAEILKYEIKD